MHLHHMTNQGRPLAPVDLRNNLGMTQLELAIALGKTPGTISQWESGRRRPLLHLSCVRRMIEVYQVDLDTLIDVFERSG